MSKKRGGTITVNTDINIDPWEVLDQVSDNELREECENRGFKVFGLSKPDKPNPHDAIQLNSDWRDLEDELRRTSRDGDWLHLEVMLVKMRALAGVPRLTTPGLKKETA